MNKKEREVIERPFSHIEVLRTDDLSKYTLPPTVRIILRKDLNKIFIIEDHSSRVFEFEYTISLKKLFKKLKKGKLSAHEIVKILKESYKNESKSFFNELINLGLIW